MERIEQYTMSMTREDIAAYYELKVSHEKRKAYAVLSLVMLGIYILLPTLILKLVFEDHWPALSHDVGLFLAIILCLCLIVAVLSVCVTQNAYRAGKLFRTLETKETIPDVLRYIHMMDGDTAWVYIAYIICYKKYLYSYVQEDGKLAVVYEDRGMRRYYETSDYHRIEDPNQKEPMLLLDMEGLTVVL